MRGYAAVGLYCPTIEANVGGAIRACQIYGAALLALQCHRYKHQVTDTMKGYRHLPVLVTDDILRVIPYACVPVAIEFISDGVPLPHYVHPERAFYIFGPENGSLGMSVLKKCRDIVYIPTSACMNLAATVNVVLYDRLAKAYSFDGRTI